jgi:dienelactone hydrolase
VIQRGTAELGLPGSAAGRDVVVSADWWFPDRDPVGLVWLQHGFTRKPAHVRGLAAVLAEQVAAVVVAPAISSRFVSRSGYWINGPRLHDAITRLLTDGRSRLEASAGAASGRADLVLPERLVLAGHSAGGNLAAAVAGRLAVAGHDGGPATDALAGVVMFDGVDHGGAIGVALDRLVGASDRPVWTIAAPDSRCNAGGKGTVILQRERAGRFVGVRLEGGTHIDAEGSDSGRAARLVCGTPTIENVDALRVLAVDWTTNLFAGTPQAAMLAGTGAGTTSNLGRAIAATL